ncbi:MAG: MFS transporter [Acidobacteriota bacterium]
MSRPGAALRAFGPLFWTAIAVELLHCLASYTMNAYLIVYLSRDLNFGDLRAGDLAGLLWFMGYFLPILIGALADRYGFRQVLSLSLGILVGGYLLASRVTAYPSMVAALLLIAAGGAAMKPVIAGTVKAVTTEATRSMGFSIYYMMINVGSLAAPFLANAVRLSTGRPALIFVACAAVEAAALLLALLFFRDPASLAPPEPRSLLGVLRETTGVLGNGRALLTAAGAAALLWAGGRMGLPPDERLGILLLWLALHFGLDEALRSGLPLPALLRRIPPQRLGDGRFLLFLLLFSGVWAIYSQIWTNIPLFILRTDPSMKSRIEWFQAVDPILIVCFQVLVSKATGRLRPLSAMVGGILVAAAAVSTVPLFGTALGAWAVGLSLAIWAFGEMMFSPRMVEYVSVTAPPDKLALYIGYGFLPLAVGFGAGPALGARLVRLFEAAGNPSGVWYAFGLWGALNAFALYLYDRALGRSGP